MTGPGPADRDGRVVVVTGGSRGIGYGVAARFAERGASVVITSRKAEAVAAAAPSLPGDVVGMVAHVADEEAARGCLAEAVARRGRVDVLVNNVGVNPHFGATLDVDLRVAGPGTRFKVTAMGYGYPALSWILADLIGASRAKDMLFTGGMVHGEQGADLGLFNRLVPDTEVRTAAIALAGQVAALPPGGVREVKRLMRDGGGRDPRARYDAENAATRAALAGRPAGDLFAGFRGGGSSAERDS